MTDGEVWQQSSTRPVADEIEPGVPATSEMPEGVPFGAEDEEEPVPLDVPQGVDEWGTTAREEAMGESLAQRVRREEPDFGEGGGGRGTDDAALAPEEAALRVEEEPAGLNYDPDPGYLRSD